MKGERVFSKKTARTKKSERNDGISPDLGADEDFDMNAPAPQSSAENHAKPRRGKLKRSSDVQFAAPGAAHVKRNTIIWITAGIVFAFWIFFIGVLVGRGMLIGERLLKSDQPQNDGTLKKAAPSASGAYSEPLLPLTEEELALMKNLPGKKSIIIVSNFTRENGFNDPEAITEAMKAKYGDFSVYTISFGIDEEGDKRARAISGASLCGRHYNAGILINDPKAFQSMIRDVFAEERTDTDGDGVCDHADKCTNTKPGVKVDEFGCPLPVTFTLNIEFDTGKAFIKPEYHDKIAQVAEYLLDYPDTEATIEGHTDTQGNDEKNLLLSQKRAESVMNYLEENFGIAADRMKAIGYGETRPIASNDTNEGRQKNRRVDVVITGTYE